jgi:hypothetical protein
MIAARTRKRRNAKSERVGPDITRDKNQINPPRVAGQSEKGGAGHGNFVDEERERERERGGNMEMKEEERGRRESHGRRLYCTLG